MLRVSHELKLHTELLPPAPERHESTQGTPGLRALPPPRARSDPLLRSIDKRRPQLPPHGASRAYLGRGLGLLGDGLLGGRLSGRHCFDF
jgi:hypothetical protein